MTDQHHPGYYEGRDLAKRLYDATRKILELQVDVEPEPGASARALNAPPATDAVRQRTRVLP